MRFALLPLLLLLLAAPCGAATLHLTGAPPLYRLEAADFHQVAAVDVTISFDPALTVESFDIGPFLQGTMAASNIKLPGKVRLGAATTAPLSGSGLLGTLRFASPIDAAPHLEIQAVLHDLEGKLLPISIDIPASPTPAPLPGIASPAPPSTTGSSPTVPSAERSPPSRSSTVTILPRSMQNDGTRASQSQSSPPIVSPPPVDRTSGAAFRAADLDKQEVGTGTPFALFRKNMASLRTLADLAQLCMPPPGIVQQPNPALSDGKTRVELRVEGVAESFSIGVQGARLLESWRGRDGWLHIELLPTAQSSEVSVIIIDQVVHNIRLAIARPVPLDPTRSAEDYLRHWQDLDGDGGITAEEAWIIAVNLLVAQRSE